MRSRGAWGLVAVLFVVVPLLELVAVIQVGQAIGAGWTILLLVLDSLLGAYLLKREGRQAWRALREALNSGRVPARELADGALILVGGTLLLTPGFITDALGFFFILPLTRPVARRLLTGVIARRLLGGGGPTRSSGQSSARSSGQSSARYDGSHDGSSSDSDRTRQRPGPDGSVVQGEVVD
ncbi:MAG TPA: FxsA family protein [Nocardioidaceae bacterium]|nr:FxsA family protein [Nocardioidaceae bacterium]